MLQFTDIHKSYSSQVILQIPNFILEKGIYWVKGANGSGKTTLLKMVAGLIPFEGDISYNGISLKKNALEYRKMVGWAEAEPLYPSFVSGRDLVSLYREIRNATICETDKLIQLFNMNNYIKNPVGTYSAGMKKKLSLVLALIGDTSVIVLDEPLITLDPEAFSTVCKMILEKHHMEGKSFLMSSHQDLDLSLTISGRELLVCNQFVS